MSTRSANPCYITLLRCGWMFKTGRGLTQNLKVLGSSETSVSILPYCKAPHHKYECSQPHLSYECMITSNWPSTVSSWVFVLTLNIPSVARQRCLPSWGPRRTPWLFCNFSAVWCGRLIKLCFLGFWNYNSVIQALLVSNIFMFIYFNRS